MICMNYNQVTFENHLEGARVITKQSSLEKKRLIQTDFESKKSPNHIGYLEKILIPYIVSPWQFL